MKRRLGGIGLAWAGLVTGICFGAPLSPSEIARLKDLDRSLGQELAYYETRYPESREIRAYAEGYRAALNARTSAPAKWPELVETASRSKVVLFGDDHSNPRDERLLARLLEELVASGKRVRLGMEALGEEFTPVLDRFNAGRITVDELFEQIEFTHHWRFPEEGYRFLVTRAHALGVALFALESRLVPHELQERDAHIADRITHQARGSAEMVVAQVGGLHIFGAGRLQERLTSSTGAPVTAILETAETQHWHWLEKTGDTDEAALLRLGNDFTYYVSADSPIDAKLRQLTDWARVLGDEGYLEERLRALGAEGFTYPAPSFLRASCTRAMRALAG